MSVSAIEPGRGRRLAGWLHARPRTQLRLLLLAPLAWMVLVYLGSLFVLLLSAFWETDSFTGQVLPFQWSLDAFESIATNPVYRAIAIRTLVVAIAASNCSWVS